MTIRFVVDLFIALGAFFALAGAIGILKMPDTFCRMQSATCVSTLGILCVAIGAILYAVIFKQCVGDAVKIGVIALMVLMTNPIGAHSIAKGAYKSGIRPEKPLDPDDYGRDLQDD